MHAGHSSLMHLISYNRPSKCTTTTTSSSKQAPETITSSTVSWRSLDVHDELLQLSVVPGAFSCVRLTCECQSVQYVRSSPRQKSEVQNPLGKHLTTGCHWSTNRLSINQRQIAIIIVGDSRPYCRHASSSDRMIIHCLQAKLVPNWWGSWYHDIWTIKFTSRILEWCKAYQENSSLKIDSIVVDFGEFKIKIKVKNLVEKY